MKLIIEENPGWEETEICIRCAMMTPELSELISLIRQHTFAVEARRDQETFYLHLEDIYYFEAVDGRGFAYTEHEVYELTTSLQQLEKDLAHTSFLRVSRTVIINVTRLKSVKSLLNGKMLATMENGEQIMINRSYVGALKKKLQQGRW